MHNFDGYIFDIDGTLTSTNELIFKSFNYVAEKYIHRSFSEKELISFFGPTEEAILNELMGDNFENAKKDYFDFYHSHHNVLAELHPGMKEILSIIKNLKIPLGVFTGKGRKAATITLRMLEIYDYFDLIITGDDVKNHKPHPEGILKFIEHFNLKNEKVILIGDAPADIKAARAAGIKIVSVLWDSYAKERVIESGSDFVFYTVDELKKFITENI
jgi:pyrophosphatase PpaX